MCLRRKRKMQRRGKRVGNLCFLEENLCLFVGSVLAEFFKLQHERARWKCNMRVCRGVQDRKNSAVQLRAETRICGEGENKNRK